MPEPHSSTLLLIDIQNGFDHPTFWGTSRSNPSFEKNIPRLLKAFRDASANVIHVVHHSVHINSPLHPASSGVSVQPYASPLPNEPVISKNVNSAFIGTELESIIKEKLGTTRLYVAGLTTDQCVSTSVRMASNLGVVPDAVQNVVLVDDATAAYAKGEWDAETVHKVNIASLNGEFCQVMTTEEVISEIATSQ